MSGDQHISITDKTAIRIGTEDRFGPKWTEPAFDQVAIPTFSILFPPWGVTGRFPENLAGKKGELLIVGHVEQIVVVGLIILEATKKLQGNTPHFVLGNLALRPGKILHVVAWKEPESGLNEGLSAALKQIQSPLLKGDDLVVNFQGFRAPNSAFMVAVPVVAAK